MKNNLIAVKRDICHGKPCFNGTRVMVWQVLELLEAGETPEEIIEGYPQLTKNHIRAALHYAAEILKTGQSFPTVA